VPADDAHGMTGLVPLDELGADANLGQAWGSWIERVGHALMWSLRSL